MNGSIRIGGALVFAILIVGGSLYMRSTKADELTESSTGELVALAPDRMYIEPTDSDGDGISDWEEQLGARVFDAITTPSSTPILPGEEEYAPPTTLTGKFAEAFFEDYLSGKMAGEDYLEDPQAFVDRAVAAIEGSVRPRTFSRLELTVIPENGTSLRTYGNDVMGASAEHKLKDINQLELLTQALEQRDASPLADFSHNADAYAAIIRETLEVPVPEPLVATHLQLLNAYEALRVDTLAMQGMFNDPLYGLARGKEYFNDNTALLQALKDIKAHLERNGIYYEDDEHAARLYALDLIQL